MSMEFKKYSVDNDLLGAMPNHERQFFLISGHIFNECSMLRKILFWSSNPYSEEVEPKEENYARGYQALMIGKILAAKMYEARKVLSRSYYGTDLSQKYEEILSEKARQSLKSFNKYFKSSGNLIKKIRMDFAFHYSEDLFQKEWQKELMTEQHVSLIGPSLGNRIYFGSEQIAATALLSHLKTDTHSAIDKFMQDILTNCQCLLAFLDEYLRRALDALSVAPGCETTHTDISITKQLADVRIPVLCDTTAKPTEHQQSKK